MPDKTNYKQFVAQFSLPEWKKLCKHRLFLHFLKSNLKIAASIAADALQRPIRYAFPAQPASVKKPKSMKRGTEDGRGSSRFKHRRFRF